MNSFVPQLQKFQLDSGDPKWSSYALDHVLEEFMSAQGGSVGEVYRGLDATLSTYSVELTGPVAAFIKDLVIRCFTRYRRSYDSANWEEIVDRLHGEATAAQLYLAIQAIPPQFVTPGLADAISRGLETTEFRDEAMSVLAV